MRLNRKGKVLLLAGAFAVSATAGMLLGGERSGQAWGWGPLDPANYWSPTSISWADTNDPGHYFYRDVSRQGGSVYDYTRIIKSILFEGNFETILSTAAEYLGIDILDHKPMDEDTKILTDGVLYERSNTVSEAYAQLARQRLSGNPVFHDYDESPDTYDAPRDKKRQRMAVGTAMEGYVDIAQQSMADNKATYEAVEALLREAAAAKGEQELKEILTKLNALKSSGDTQLSTLLTAKSQMENDFQRVRLDDQFEQDKTLEKANILVVDPYDKKQLESYPYEREKGRGFVPFE